MPKSVNPDEYAKGLFPRTEEYADKVRKHYVTATNALLKLSAGAQIKEGELFSFASDKKVSAEATTILRGLYSAVYNEIKTGVVAEWGFANISCDELIASIFGKGAVDDNHFARWFSRNQEAINSFFTRKDNGLNLSQKVWNYTGQLKGELELALSSALGQGHSSATVSRKVKQYLTEPDRFYRRFRVKTDAVDKEGNTIYDRKWKRRVLDKKTGKYTWIDEDIKSYKSGQGIYRSSHKNAMRLARTEPNMAYREADHDRWQQMDFVTGEEIQRSKNSKKACRCDALAGIYPKGYLFKGWHPQCLCYKTPILATKEEMIALQKRMLNGEDVSDFVSKNQVNDVPSSYKSWIKDNTERINNAKSVPYFIKDNYPDGDISKGLKFIGVQNAKQLQIAKTKAVSSANSLLDDAKSLGNVNVSSLTQALKLDNIDEIKSATKLLSNDVKIATQQATALYKEQPTTWGLSKEFGKDSADSFMTSWNKYTVQKANLTDLEYLKVIEKEIFYGQKNVGKYATSEKMIYFLEKEKERVLLSIEKKQIIEGVDNVLKFSQTTKSSTMKKLTSEWDSLVSSEVTNTQLKTKANELKKYYDKLEKDRIARLRKNTKQIKSSEFKELTDTEIETLLERFDNATESIDEIDAILRVQTKKEWVSLTEIEKKIVTKYTQTYSYLNEPLRGLPYYGSLTPNIDHIHDLPILTKVLEKFKILNNTVVRRGVNDFPISDLGYNSLSNLKKGDVFTDKGFLSTAAHKHKGFDNSYDLVIVVPKGAKGIYAEPFSHYTDELKFNYNGEIWDGKSKESIGGEFEWIGQRGSQFKVVKKVGKRIFLQLVGQLK